MEFRGLNCKKCMYFDHKKKLASKNMNILGFCNIRLKFVTDESINKEFCKDKAVVDPVKYEKMKDQVIEIANKYDTKNDKRRFVTF